jgi:cytochrome c553
VKVSIMRRIRLALAALAIASSAGVSLAGDVVTVSRNCTWCHGALGHGYSTAPRLAGQRHLYIMNQLYDFRSHARDNPFSQQYMWGATASLGLETARELADYFASIPPTPANDGDRALAEIGRAIYLEGIPEYDVVSCAACHGPNAEGIGPIPRLGGLSYSYLTRRLAQWGEGYHVAAAPPMPRIASRLAPDEIAALASYLSFVP